ncbi:hypothetical protein cyc_03157 [Cyclospora cayetanensis]|uniref:Uncharacterized protein n=1 Tax=Cyclospora cayetanensis TaxID=88456 RepID=A0A1D3DAG9_9EIME|nr:hypothetical protein cyc_03157 [Cyclospora cayetanensis]
MRKGLKVSPPADRGQRGQDPSGIVSDADAKRRVGGGECSEEASMGRQGEVLAARADRREGRLGGRRHGLGGHSGVPKALIARGPKRLKALYRLLAA